MLSLCLFGGDNKRQDRQSSSHFSQLSVKASNLLSLLYLGLGLTEAVAFDEALMKRYVSMSDGVSYLVGCSGGSRGSELKRNGVKSPQDRRMENGVSFYILQLHSFFLESNAFVDQ